MSSSRCTDSATRRAELGVHSRDEDHQLDVLGAGARQARPFPPASRGPAPRAPRSTSVSTRARQSPSWAAAGNALITITLPPFDRSKPSSRPRSTITSRSVVRRPSRSDRKRRGGCDAGAARAPASARPPGRSSCPPAPQHRSRRLLATSPVAQLAHGSCRPRAARAPRPATAPRARPPATRTPPRARSRTSRPRPRWRRAPARPPASPRAGRRRTRPPRRPRRTTPESRICSAFGTLLGRRHL